MRKVLLFLLALLFPFICNADEAGVHVTDLALSSESVGQYECLEMTFQIDAELINPFDTWEIDIQAIFTTPSGHEVCYPAFYQRAERDLSQDFVPERNPFDYDYDYDTKRFNFVPEAKDNWCVRFSWNEVGEYTFRFEIILNGKKYFCDGSDFIVTESTEKGIIIRSVSNPQYLAYRESGEQFIPIGMNNAQNWSTFGYSSVMKAIAENGGNFARVWTGTDYGYSSLTVENWNYGPNMYNLDMAEAFDRVTRVAKEESVRLQICFDSFSALNTDNEYGQFESVSIYNVKNGGYITEAENFWVDEACRRDYMNRVRYLMARCVWDPNVVLWELFNEINGCDGMDATSVQKDAADWCCDMRDFIRSIDPYKRLVGVSFHSGDRLDTYKELAENCNLDYIQVHHYDARDVAATMNLIARNAQKYCGMILIGEFGSMENYREKDPEWMYVHIGLWSGLHTGSACVPMYWFHEELVESGYQSYLRPLRKYIDTFNFAEEPLEVADVSVKGNVRVIGLTNESKTSSALYVYNSNYTWANPDPEPAEKVIITLDGFTRGKVQIDVWDTMNGEIIRREEQNVSQQGTIEIIFDSLMTDSAILVHCIP